MFYALLGAKTNKALKSFTKVRGAKALLKFCLTQGSAGYQQ